MSGVTCKADAAHSPAPDDFQKTLPLLAGTLSNWQIMALNLILRPQNGPWTLNPNIVPAALFSSLHFQNEAVDSARVTVKPCPQGNLLELLLKPRIVNHRPPLVNISILWYSKIQYIVIRSTWKLEAWNLQAPCLYAHGSSLNPN